MSQPNIPESGYHQDSNLPRRNQYMGPSGRSCHDLSIRGRPRGIASSGIPIHKPDLDVFAELHAERTYLISCLQHENKKAKYILRKILALENILLLYPKFLARRDGKQKKLGWLKCRFKETNHQEQAILARLGQLSFEIQSRDRWIELEAERNNNFQPSHWSQIQRMHTNTTSDNFRQGASTVTYTNSIHQQNCEPQNSPWPPISPNRVVHLAIEDNSQLNDTIGSGNSSLQIETIKNEVSQTSLKLFRSLSIDNTDLIVLETGSSSLLSPRNKRHSL